MSDIPRPEHPRPDFERSAWQNLNGKWQFAVDTSRSGLEKGWSAGADLPREITVPFCPESRLSGIGETDFLEAVWYRRKFTLAPAMRGGRVLVHFGAVDYEARVWVNGTQVAHHRGGFTPFAADITEAIDGDGENEIVVYAVDDERSGAQPLGKQSSILHSHGCRYTRTTGIWQTVWIEAVPETHVTSLVVWPDAANGRVTLEIAVARPQPGVAVEVEASVDGKVVASAAVPHAQSFNALTLDIPDPVLWEPGKPFLYDLKVRLRGGFEVVDEVSSYFGLREVAIDGDRVLINGKPVFQRLILDQGFWPEGIYTAPSDSELKADIERSIAMGFNGARLHQKVFEPRTLYWADKLGYLLWGEFPDWGCAIAHSPQARENLQREWMEVLLRDRSHPAIVAWTPLNEAHSRHERYNPVFTAALVDLTKRIDPSRPVVDSSGYTHIATDIWDLHDYDQNPESFRTRYAGFADDPKTETLARNDADHEPPYMGQPLVVSEYGGARWDTASREGPAWGYGDTPNTEEEFVARFAGLTDVLLGHPHMAGLCYTQLTDVEQEVNGLYTYDRKPKFDPALLKAAMEKKAAIERE